VSLSAPAWADEFLDYKDLKALLKVLGRNSSAAPAAGEAPPSGDGLAAHLAACPHETAFFARLHVELGKVAAFYGQVEEQLAQRYRQLLADFEEIAGSAAEVALATQVGDPLPGVLEEVGAPGRSGQSHRREPRRRRRDVRFGRFCESLKRFYCNLFHSPAAVACLLQTMEVDGAGLSSSAPSRAMPGAGDVALTGLLAQIGRFYTALLQLENMAVMCYCGFGKILKKHDKLTGCSTKGPFMQAMVNTQSFAQYSRLRVMLAGSETVFGVLMSLLPREALHDRPALAAHEAARLADLKAMQPSVQAHRAKEVRAQAGVVNRASDSEARHGQDGSASGEAADFDAGKLYSDASAVVARQPGSAGAARVSESQGVGFRRSRLAAAQSELASTGNVVGSCDTTGHTDASAAGTNPPSSKRQRKHADEGDWLPHDDSGRKEETGAKTATTWDSASNASARGAEIVAGVDGLGSGAGVLRRSSAGDDARSSDSAHSADGAGSLLQLASLVMRSGAMPTRGEFEAGGGT